MDAGIRQYFTTRNAGGAPGAWELRNGPSSAHHRASDFLHPWPVGGSGWAAWRKAVSTAAGPVSRRLLLYNRGGGCAV